MKYCFEVNIKTVSEANRCESPYVSNRRHQSQQFFVRQAYSSYVKGLSLPCRVKMTRMSNRKLDEEDNLRMALKWIKDEIGACIQPEKVVAYVTKSGRMKLNKGHADGGKMIKWEYDQVSCSIPGVRIEIEEIEAN